MNCEETSCQILQEKNDEDENKHDIQLFKEWFYKEFVLADEGYYISLGDLLALYKHHKMKAADIYKVYEFLHLDNLHIDGNFKLPIEQWYAMGVKSRSTQCLHLQFICQDLEFNTIHYHSKTKCGLLHLKQISKVVKKKYNTREFILIDRMTSRTYLEEQQQNAGIYFKENALFFRVVKHFQESSSDDSSK